MKVQLDREKGKVIVKIADFGLAVTLPPGTDSCEENNAALSYRWAAPEGCMFKDICY